jgi:hypothetical protein
MERKEKAEGIIGSALKELERNDPLLCVDDRLLASLKYRDMPNYIIRPEEFSGAQMLGGSLAIFDIALELAPEGQELDFDLLFDLTKKAHEYSGFTLGVHMHDDHGEWNEETIQGMLSKIENEDVSLPGCGYDGLAHNAENPLGLSGRTVEFHKKYPNRIALFVKNGVKLAILGGNHVKVEEALAIINEEEGKTLDQVKAHELGQPTYNHDQKAFEQILGGLVKAAEEVNPKWAKNISEKGNELYLGWYKVVGNKLAGMDPVAI